MNPNHSTPHKGKEGMEKEKREAERAKKKKKSSDPVSFLASAGFHNLGNTCYLN